MGKHVERMTHESAIAELGARLAIPSEWGSLGDAVRFLRSMRKGKHAIGFGTPKNAKAMRNWYRGE
jgi:hypothetical protein